MKYKQAKKRRFQHPKLSRDYKRQRRSEAKSFPHRRVFAQRANDPSPVLAKKINSVIISDLASIGWHLFQQVIKGACAITFVKSYLNGEYGLRNSFWFGLVIGGTITSRLAYMLQPVVWRLYDAERIFSAIILQFIIVGLFLLVMGFAVGVLFAAFHQRQAGFWGWLSCAISGFVIRTHNQDRRSQRPRYPCCGASNNASF